MDSRRLDQITRSFASGMSRRGAMTGIAAALGLSAVGALRSSTEATSPLHWDRCWYHCLLPADYYEYRCQSQCGKKIRNQYGSFCDYSHSDCTDCWQSKQDCEG